MALAEMAKVHVIGERRSIDRVLAALYDAAILHVVDVLTDPAAEAPPMALDEARLAEIEHLRYLRSRVSGMLALLPEGSGAGGPAPPLDELRRQVDAAGERIGDLARRLDALAAEEESLPRYAGSLRMLLPLVGELPRFDGYGTAALLIDSRHRGALADLNAALEAEIGGVYEIVSGELDAATVGAVVVFPRRHRDRVEALLEGGNVSHLRLPAGYEELPLGEAVAAMERRIAALPDEAAAVRAEMAAIAATGSGWRAALADLDSRLTRLGAVGRLGTTVHTFVASGWVPVDRLDELSSVLAAAVGDAAVIEEVTPRSGEMAPVRMDNPRPVRPFEALIRLRSLPRAGSIDPTGLMAVFLPLFFGMMLADVAYGAVLLAGSVLARRRAREGTMLADLAEILALSAGWSIVWGFVFGELLGDLGHRLFGMEPLWINREEALTPLLVFALAVGAAHVTLGLLLGVWEAVRSRSRHDLLGRGGTLVALAGLFLLVGTLVGMVPDGVVTPAIAALLVGLVLLIASEGSLGILLGPLGLVETIGNILSYLRIAAIGLASVYLARVANELGAVFPLGLGIVVAALFHALNLVLGVFSPTIQALRLHYVEFFGKFFEEGGEEFTPFGAPVTPPAPSL